MKNVVITGANGGIGFEAARLFAQNKDRLFLLCRPGEKSDRALRLLQEETNNTNIEMIEVDLAEMESLSAAMDKIIEMTDRIDVLINNAGVQKKQYTTDSRAVELSLAVNFRAPYLLTRGLIELLRKSGSGRIINVVSELYKKGEFPFPPYKGSKKYNAGKAYANSKLATVLMSQEMARRFKADEVQVHCLHPGVLATDALRDYPKLMLKLMSLILEKPEAGGKRIYDLSTLDKYANHSGAYVYKDQVRELDKRALNENDQLAALEMAESLSIDNQINTNTNEVKN